MIIAESSNIIKRRRIIYGPQQDYTGSASQVPDIPGRC